jgi:hypothetical protein
VKRHRPLGRAGALAGALRGARPNPGKRAPRAVRRTQVRVYDEQGTARPLATEGEPGAAIVALAMEMLKGESR